MRFVKYFVLAIFLLFVLTVLAIVVGPQLVDWSKNKDKLESFISSATGYNVKLEGAITFQTLPSPKVYVERVVVEPFAGKDNIFEAQNFSAEASLMGLLALRLDLENVALDNPIIKIYTYANGQKNFDSGKKSSAGGPQNLGLVTSLGVFSIKNAKISVLNEMEKTRREITDMNLAIDGTVLRNTQVDMKGMLDGTPFSVNGTFGLDNLQELASRADLTYAESKVTIKGVVSDVFTKPAYDGHLGMSLARPGQTLQKLLQQAESMNIPVKTISFLGNLTATPSQFKVENMELTADEIKASGSMDYRIGDTTNSLDAKMRFEKLDLDKLLAVASPESAAKPSNADSSAPWDDSYIDFGKWRNTNAKVDLSVGEMTWNERPIRQATLRFNIQDGTFTLEGLDMSVGSGYVRSTGRADLGNPVRGQLDVKLEELPLNFLVSKEKAKLFDVPLNAETQLLFAGNSQLEMVKSLGGQIKLNANKGTIKGVNLVDLNKTMQSIFLGKTLGGESVIQLFNANFTVENGIVKSDDLDLRSDPLVIKGSGKIDLPAKAINFKFRPMSSQRLGVLLPVNVVGPWSAPKIIPDIMTPQGIMSAVGAVVGGPVGAAAGAVVGTQADKLMNVPFNFKDGKNLKDNVKNFFMGKPPLPDSTLEEKPAEAPVDAAPQGASPAPRAGNGTLLPPPQGN